MRYEGPSLDCASLWKLRLFLQSSLDKQRFDLIVLQDIHDERLGLIRLGLLPGSDHGVLDAVGIEPEILKGFGHHRR